MSIKDDIEGIKNLVQYARQYPKGAVKIGHHYYNISALIKALEDIRIRATVDSGTNADKLLMQILAGLI